MLYIENKHDRTKIITRTVKSEDNKDTPDSEEEKKELRNVFLNYDKIGKTRE